ncbi:MAG TPA: DUF6249 domain-containing protein [Saprospiraceae bacterium]|nr:DUF6249 domain-containing protein [Saprospiraceae bacterium]HNG89955.1 DUF6249 domain-containing protein [Saprospiraceae bacterium]
MAIIFLFGVLPVSVFLMIIVLRYLENRENMAMIERGMDPKSSKAFRKRHLDPSQTLKSGMMFVGAGLGLLLATIVSSMMPDQDSTSIYFSLIAIFGGVGMLAAYFYERRNPVRDEEE